MQKLSTVLRQRKQQDLDDVNHTPVKMSIDFHSRVKLIVSEKSRGRRYRAECENIFVFHHETNSTEFVTSYQELCYMFTDAIERGGV